MRATNCPDCGAPVVFYQDDRVTSPFIVAGCGRIATLRTAGTWEWGRTSAEVPSATPRPDERPRLHRVAGRKVSGAEARLEFTRAVRGLAAHPGLVRV